MIGVQSRIRKFVEPALEFKTPVLPRLSYCINGSIIVLSIGVHAPYIEGDFQCPGFRIIEGD